MKLAKLSLAAIMTVGALSAVNAGSLEESIKGVDFSGFARYRLNGSDYNDVSQNANDFDLNTRFVAPVTDNIKFTAALKARYDASNKTASVKSRSDYTPTDLYFSYTTDALAIKAGLQPVNTPLNDSGYGGDFGTGVSASYNLGAVTLAGAYFSEFTLGSDEVFGTKQLSNELYALAALGNFGPVNAQAWYITAGGSDVNFASFVQVDAKFSGVSLKAQYAGTDLDVAPALRGGKDGMGMFYGLGAGFATDAFHVNLNYTQNDADQPFYTFNADGNTMFPGWRLGYKTTNRPDAQTLYGDVGAKFGKFGVKAGYAQATYRDTVGGTEIDASEIWGQASYKVAKNLNTYFKYSDMSNDVADNEGQYYRFEAKYSF